MLEGKVVEPKDEKAEELKEKPEISEPDSNAFVNKQNVDP